MVVTDAIMDEAFNDIRAIIEPNPYRYRQGFGSGYSKNSMVLCCIGDYPYSLFSTRQIARVTQNFISSDFAIARNSSFAYVVLHRPLVSW